MLWFLAGALLFCCTNSHKDQLTETLELQSERIDLPDTFLTKAGMLMFSNEYLVLHDIYSTDYIFNLFEKETLKLKGKFGKIGPGPQEIGSSGFFSISNEGDKLWVFDAGKLNMLMYDLSKELISKPSQIEPVPNDINLVMHFAQVHEGPIFVSQNFMNPEKYSFVRFQTSSDSVHYFGDPFYAEDNLVLSDYFSQYSNSFAAHHQKSKFIRAYQRYDLIQIINSSGKVEKEYKGPLFKPLIKREDVLSHYRNIRITDNFIYAEYVGGHALNEKGTGLNYPNIIRVFSWKLEPVAELRLDQPIMSFDIDTENERIVAYTENELSPLILFNFDEESL